MLIFQTRGHFEQNAKYSTPWLFWRGYSGVPEPAHTGSQEQMVKYWIILWAGC